MKIEPLLQKKLNDLLNVTVINADIDELVGIIRNHRLGITRSAWTVAKYCYIARENKQLYGLGSNWAYELSEKTGYSDVVIRRYANIYEIFLDGVPAALRLDVLYLGVGKLIPLLPLYKKKLLTYENWMKFIKNPKHIAQIAKEITGDSYRPTAVHIRIKKTGELYAVTGDERYIQIGEINIALLNQNATAKKAILRIIENADIQVIK